MFPKESFTGQDKKKAKSHWAEFSKYLDYQDQQGTIPQDLAHLPEIKSMFKLTLQDIALGWFKTESPTWLTEDQMKQAFLKMFNPWGDTRCQQQNAWNKLKFDMTKDDVDAFVVDMKMLASILGHNDDVITEKFKDIFPDPNIEAALIAMDNFAAMQTKAKQLVQIYKPAHDSPLASAAILVHTAGNTPTKGKSSQPKSNQHQLAPINQSQDPPNTGKTEYNGENADEDVDAIEVHMAVETEGTLITGMIIKIEEPAMVKDNGTFNIIEGEVKIIHFEGAEDSGMEMTLITVTEITGIEIPKVKVILTGRRWDNSRGQGHSDQGRGRRWNPNQQYHDPGYHQQTQFANPNHYCPQPMGHQYRYPIPYEQYPYPEQQQYQSQMLPAPSQQATNI